jgi:hypothetical protein
MSYTEIFNLLPNIDPLIKNKIHYSTNLRVSIHGTQVTFDFSNQLDFTPEKLLVADFSSDPWHPVGKEIPNVFDNFYRSLTDLGINFLLLSHLPSDHLRLPRLLHYQRWNHYGQEFFNILPLTDSVKKYKISCLNLNPHSHRIYNYLLLRKKSYFNDCLFSFHTANPEDLFQNYAKLPTDMKLEWKSIMNDLPKKADRIEIPDVDFSNIKNRNGNLPFFLDLLNHDAYTDSYINLVTESTVAPNLFLSEKTWKPIASGQLFLIFGSPGAIKYLRESGVDTFDDVIDHDSYDNELDWKVRAHNIHALLDNLVTRDLAKIYELTKERRQQNQKKFFSGEFGAGLFDDLKMAIAQNIQQ